MRRNGHTGDLMISTGNLGCIHKKMRKEVNRFNPLRVYTYASFSEHSFTNLQRYLYICKWMQKETLPFFKNIDLIAVQFIRNALRETKSEK